MRIHTLGCGSAKPTLRHNPSSTVVEHHGNLYMIDCGEGTQKEMQRQRLSTARLKHIFLTHLHGDHVLGLPGLVSSMTLGGHSGEITIHTFEEGKEILSGIFNYFNRNSPMKVSFDLIDPDYEGTIWENNKLKVRSVRLSHRIPTVGFVFEEKPGLRHLNRPMCDFHGVPVSRFNLIKGGSDFEKPDGTTVPNDILTFPPTAPRRYAHISDTLYMPELASKIKGVDLLFHETTYLEEHQSLARERYHSTAGEAAKTARDAEAGRLLTGHYSSRYNDDTLFLAEAREVFPNTILNREGLITEC